MPAKKNSLKKALVAAIEKYAKQEGTIFACAFRDALTDMRHIADDSDPMIDYPKVDENAHSVYCEEVSGIGRRR